MKDLLDIQMIDWAGDQREKDRNYKRRYKEKLAQEGFKQVTVKIPIDCDADIKRIAEYMREHGHAPDMYDTGI